MRIVVIIFAVLGLLGSIAIGLGTFVRSNKEVKDLNEIYTQIDSLKAKADAGDELAKMQYDMTKEVTEKTLGADVTPGKVTTFGFLGLLTGIVALATLVLVFTKKDNITLYLSIAGIVLALATYFLAPAMPEQTGIFAQATFKELALTLLIPSLSGFAFAILAGKLRKAPVAA